MPSFTKQIDLRSGVHRTVEFKRMYTVKGVRYYVLMNDPAGKPWMMHMEKVLDKWKITNCEDLPSWCSSIENVLSQAIEEHLQK